MTPSGLEGAALLAAGFGLGALHALDADHVVAVSALTRRGSGAVAGAALALRWALGHALSVLLLGAAALALGVALPESLAVWSERLVGLTLVGLGLWVLIDLRRREAHLHFHEHEGLPSHAHWHRHHGDERHGAAHRDGHSHAPVLVGLLHGAAGTAPLLAVVPAAAQGRVLLGLAYLAAFGVGTGCAMAVFGGLFGALQRGGARGANPGWLLALRSGVGVTALVVGAVWLAPAA